MNEHSPHPSDRPDWASSAAQLVASCTDLVSGRSYAVWFDPQLESKALGFRERRRRRPFLIARADGGAPATALQTLRHVVEWHDRNVISPGWQIVERTPEEWAELGLSDVEPSLASPSAR